MNWTIVLSLLGATAGLIALIWVFRTPDQPADDYKLPETPKTKEPVEELHAPTTWTPVSTEIIRPTPTPPPKKEVHVWDAEKEKRRQEKQRQVAGLDAINEDHIGVNLDAAQDLGDALADLAASPAILGTSPNPEPFGSHFDVGEPAGTKHPEPKFLPDIEPQRPSHSHHSATPEIKPEEPAPSHHHHSSPASDTSSYHSSSHHTPDPPSHHSSYDPPSHDSGSSSYDSGSSSYDSGSTDSGGGGWD